MLQIRVKPVIISEMSIPATLNKRSGYIKTDEKMKLTSCIHAFIGCPWKDWL